jgi:hypothetical protein
MQYSIYKYLHEDMTSLDEGEMGPDLDHDWSSNYKQLALMSSRKTSIAISLSKTPDRGREDPRESERDSPTLTDPGNMY